MNADSLALLIAASGGFVIASLVWLHLGGLALASLRRRTEKETWAAASRFYARKGLRS